MLPFRKAALPNTFAVVIPLSFLIVVVNFTFGAPWVAPGYILFAVLFGWYWCSQRDQELEKRASQPASFLWSVTVDGVSVGTLPDAQYAALFLSALRDWRTAWRYGLGLMRWLTGFAARIAWLVPLLIFWDLVWVAVTSPHAYLHDVHRLVAHGPADFVSHITLAIALVVLAEMVGFAAGLKSLPNAYEHALHRMVRQEFALAAAGAITLAWESSKPPPSEAGIRSPVRKLNGVG
jgi:hypothetical protein